MKKMLSSALAAAAMLCAVSAPVKADIVIDVVPWLAPNAFGSPSWGMAVTNAVTGMMNGGVATGTGPSAFIPNSNITAAQAIVTGFPSWMGQANPGAVYGPAYANELGNRMTFAVGIVGTAGTEFSISQLSFNSVSSDPGNALGFGYAAGSYSYSPDYVGVIYGQNGAPNTYVTSGPSTQLVNAIFGRGSGDSYAAYCPTMGACDTAAQQAAIAAAAIGPSYTFTGTYTIDDFSGSGTFNVAAVPEPSTWAMMILGFIGIACYGHRQRRKAQIGALTAA